MFNILGWIKFFVFICIKKVIEIVVYFDNWVIELQYYDVENKIVYLIMFYNYLIMVMNWMKDIVEEIFFQDGVDDSEVIV